jgi:hypothetical integral membrane protein (TIGR02206 family)
MLPPHPFRVFGPSHLAALGATAAVTAALVLLARRARSPRLVRVAALSLVGLLLLAEAAVVILAARTDLPTLKDHLPFQLCDWVIFAAAAALAWRRQLPYEIAYFWGLSGTLQALLTPDLAEDFPNPHFLTFQALHAGAVVAILFLTLGLGMRPRWRSLWRAWLWLQVYVASTAAIDRLLASNYGYLLAKPVQASLYDYLGPWPWYIVTLEALSLALFLLCYLPFALLDRRRRGSPSAVEP